MTDDLKRQFEQLVADPPPPSAVPSETVFARVRTVRRRRTAGVVTLVAAAVVAVAVAAGNLTDINSSPPVTHTPSAPVTVVTGPPSTTPTTTPSSTPSSATSTTKGTTTGTNVGANTSTPGTHTPPARPQLGVHIVLKPIVQGRDVTMRVTLSGRALVPSDEANKPLSTSGTDFLNLLGGTLYKFGDGYQSGSDAGAVNCLPTTKTATGPFTYSTETHTFTKPGTYTLYYQVKYCGNSGWVPVNKTAKVTVK